MTFKHVMKSVWKAGYVEKDVVLPDGTNIHYAQSASLAKPPLLLIHGQTSQWMDYAKVLPQLAKDFHVFAVDCHGHGKSSKNPNSYTATKIGEDFSWFIDFVIQKPVILSGHSSGGLIAAWLAAHKNHQIKALLLEDPPFFSTFAKGQRLQWEKSFAYVDTYAPINAFLNQQAENDWVIYYLKHAAWRKFLDDKTMGKMISYAEKYRKKHPLKPLYYFFLPDSVNQLFRFLNDYDLYFGQTFYDGSWFEDYNPSLILSSITCPCILIHAKWSIDENGLLQGAMTGDDAQRANNLMKNSQLYFIDSGHNCHYEKPKDFLLALTKLVEKCS